MGEKMCDRHTPRSSWQGKDHWIERHSWSIGNCSSKNGIIGFRGAYAPIGGCILVLIILSPCILCCCIKKIVDMKKNNHHNDRRTTAGQEEGQISLCPIGNNPVPQSDVPVPPGFKLVPLSELHGTQAPPPG